MEGLIVKIISNKCYVKINEEIVICTMRGKLRQMKLSPLVGDHVIIDLEKKVIKSILPRKNTIRRPPVSNITQAFVVTSLREPDFSTNLLDKYLVELEFNHIKPIICLTKKDLITDNEWVLLKKVFDYYHHIGYTIILNTELDVIKKLLENEISVFIGQTGAGKSTLLNNLSPELNLETNGISVALGRGKHTTRHVEIFMLFNGMVLDTPGFSALSFSNMTKKEVRDSFIEFKNYHCLYEDCMHVDEDDCALKKAVQNNFVLSSRLENYYKLIKDALSDNEVYKRK